MWSEDHRLAISVSCDMVTKLHNLLPECMRDAERLVCTQRIVHRYYNRHLATFFFFAECALHLFRVWNSNRFDLIAMHEHSVCIRMNCKTTNVIEKCQVHGVRASAHPQSVITLHNHFIQKHRAKSFRTKRVRVHSLCAIHTHTVTHVRGISVFCFVSFHILFVACALRKV